MPALAPIKRLALALAVILAVATVASACPTCKVALASQNPEHGDIVTGFFWSILFMMAMPFTILGLMIGYMYLLVRRARRAQAAQSAAQATVASTETSDEREPAGIA